ncbi:ABC transporter, ATP-binding protein [Pseudoscardovia radai]|uniref:ABC transporter, ATP-binding protein n=1 Tax=Pseudoscardovia radai TaxID=987066 RepID=A0A261EZY6_9BIFI|nr:ABC transporter ATP-binding protein [Pseudoscardovia radai]OZG52236.1 ABC transporter, ATP-binding protein [Pseudoscardovia radai]
MIRHASNTSFRNSAELKTAETASSIDVALSVHGLRHSYGGDAFVVDGVSLNFPVGSWTAVMGPSGSGKSTLLYCMSGLLRPSEGRVLCSGTDITGLSPDELTRFRREHFGFVFQGYNLLPELTCTQNVMLPTLFGPAPISEAQADEALTSVGLDGYGDRYPDGISGGQSQRVAIARALATHPGVVFADEPTGALDTHTTRAVMDLFGMVVKHGQTLIMVTHDPNVAACADRVVFLVDGRVASVHGRMSASDIALAFANGFVSPADATTIPDGEVHISADSHDGE